MRMSGLATGGCSGLWFIRIGLGLGSSFEAQRPMEFEGLDLVELDMVLFHGGLVCLSGGSLRWSS